MRPLFPHTHTHTHTHTQRTRVRLDDDHEPKTSISEYINANYITSFNGQPREYIAAMGPLDCTIEAFWRMVFSNRSPAIVMTTPLMENGIIKCARYWPTVKYNEQKKYVSGVGVRVGLGLGEGLR